MQIHTRAPHPHDPEHGRLVLRERLGRGDLATYEEWRSKDFGYRHGERNIRRIIEEAKNKGPEPEPAVSPPQVEVPKDLDPDARSLFARIVRQPGKSRRYLQQAAHLRGNDFHRALRLLERRRLVSWKDEASTGGRKRRTYFPAPNPPTMTPQDRSMVGTQRRTHG